MNVLLVSLNRESEPFTATPLGVALVGGALRDAGHEVMVVDLLSSRDFRAEVREAIASFSPGVIGISLRNIESSTEFLLPSYRETVGFIKSMTDAPVALGGPGFSIMPESMLRYLGVGLGVVGEGERAAVGMVSAIEAGSDPALVPGVCSLQDGQYTFTRPQAPLELDGPPPDWSLINLDGYDMVGVQTKRGCSFSCVYCTYPALEGRRMRLKAPALVASELESVSLARPGVSFYFVDNVFNNPRSHAVSVCEAIISRGLNIEWACLASPIGFDLELASLMARAGCKAVEIGADSLSDGQLRRIWKSFTKADVFRASDAARASGMMSMVFLILGGPGEDEASLTESFDALDRMAPDKVFAVGGIRVYPGTPMASIAVEEGVIKPDDDLLEPRFYVSPMLGDRLYRMAEDYFSRKPDWIYYPANGVLSGKKPAGPAELVWDGYAKSCFDQALAQVPALLRPIARRAVNKKARELAISRGLYSVTTKEVADAFVSETPGPFRGPMTESLRKMGLL